MLQQVEDDGNKLGIGDLERLQSTGAPSRFAVMRPWPMPSVIEAALGFQLAVGL